MLWHLVLTLLFAPLPFLLERYHLSTEQPVEEEIAARKASTLIPLVTDAHSGQQRVLVYRDRRGVFHLILVRFPQRPTSSPPETRSLDTIIQRQARRYRIDPALVKAMILAESHFDPYAVSSKGAQGLMQLMPQTARLLGVADPWDPEQNISGGVRYLRSLLDRFQGDLTLALAAYNAGPAAVETWQGVPPFPETQAYVRRVKAFYQREQQTRKGNGYANTTGGYRDG
ncbi:MAG: lytic transglycosylase domain-containing protein [Nitrospinota bacterium]|nr:MAG: lytic transglycosylase domain-containing protein [Nitrospinota bacterium]